MAQEKENKVWIDEKGTIHIFETEPFTEQDIYHILETAKEALKKLRGKGKILVKITEKVTIPVTSSYTRKILVEETKNIIKDPGFEKAAIYGGSAVSRTVASFIIMATGVKNIKIFKTKEKALEWLEK